MSDVYGSAVLAIVWHAVHPVLAVGAISFTSSFRTWAGSPSKDQLRVLLISYLWELSVVVRVVVMLIIIKLLEPLNPQELELRSLRLLKLLITVIVDFCGRYL